MSNKSRYRRTTDQRRRRSGATATGAAAAFGSAVAAAFISMGTAFGDTDTDTPPDPFTDMLQNLLGPNATAAELTIAAAADNTFATQDPTLAAAIDNLDDTVSNLPPGDDPFSDLLPSNPTPMQIAQATFGDFQLLNTDLANGTMVAATLDAQIDAAEAGPPPPPPPPLTDPAIDPFTELVGPNAPPAQIAIATAADNTFAAEEGTSPTGEGVLLSQAIGTFSIPAPVGDKPFEDLLPTSATTAQIGEAMLYDDILVKNAPALAASLDAQIDAAEAGPPPPPAEPAPFVDALGSTATAQQIADATAADNELDAMNPVLAQKLDSLIQAGPLPAGNPSDANAFVDLGLPNGAALDAEFPALAASLEPLVEELIAPPPPPPAEPAPFVDALGSTATAQQIADATAADNELDAMNPTLAAQLDALIQAGPLPAGNPSDANAFVDLGLPNGAALDAEFPTLAASLEPLVEELITPPPPPPTEPQPFVDALPTSATAQQIADATAADNELDAMNPTLAAQLDALIQAGPLPAGNPSDANAFVDLGLPNGAALDAEFPTLAASLEPLVEELITPPPPPPTEPQPFVDALPTSATAQQIADATAADNELDAMNPTLAAQLDALIQAGPLPAGNPSDANAFVDLGLPNGAALDAEFPTLAASLEPLVEELITPPPAEPAPFVDALPTSATAQQIADATAADNELDAMNPTLAAQLDALIQAGPLPAGNPSDADAFVDLGLPNGAALDAEFPTLAASLEPLVEELIAAPPPPEPAPFVDALPTTATMQQVADATAADNELDAMNLFLAQKLDSLIEAGPLPAGNPSDANAFVDLGLPNGAALDAEFPTMAASLEPLVDQLLGLPPPPPPSLPDDDAFSVLAQWLDPNAFTTNTADALVPEDFIGQFAAELDALVTPWGIEPDLEALVDQLIAFFTTTF